MRQALRSIILLGTAVATVTQAESADPSRGQAVFRACAACHSLERNRHMTGPSLADLWGRRAGGIEGFRRYSPALKSSTIVWDDRTLDEWLKDPKAFIPGNYMTFTGIKDAQSRADLLAFLKDATRIPSTQSARPESEMAGGMGMGTRAAPKLKKLDPGERVRRVSYCGDTYRVETDDGQSREFWERNLRFKTDASDEGPEPGAPAILEAGMMGDRASIIFAGPEEFSRFITRAC